jgi:hypothetical protein
MAGLNEEQRMLLQEQLKQINANIGAFSKE